MLVMVIVTNLLVHVREKIECQLEMTQFYLQKLFVIFDPYESSIDQLQLNETLDSSLLTS